MATKGIKLTDEQAEVAAITDGDHLVAAGAGAGKTATLIQRVVALLVAAQVAAKRVLVLTFTRGAAREFSERAVACGALGAHDVEVRTLHSWGFAVLREQGLAHEVLQRGDQIKILRDGFRELGFREEADSFTPDTVLKEIAAFKREGLLPSDVHRRSDVEPRVARLYSYYEQHGWDQGRADFADMILRTAQLLSSTPSLAAQYGQRYDHVMVDETQDNNAEQWAIVNALRPHLRSTLCVGDENQSIFAFAGAISKLFIDWARRDDVTFHLLPHNFRSTRQIVAACERLISYNQGRLDKRIVALRDGPEPVHTHCATTGEQAVAVRKEIEQALTERGRSPRDIHVLYRTRASSASIERELLSADVPYVIRGGRGFFTLSHIKVVTAYMRAATGDMGGLNAYVVNVPKRFLGRAFIMKAQDCDWSFTGLDVRCKGRLARAWGSLRSDLQVLQAAAKSGAAPSHVLKLVLELTGADGYSLEQTLGGAASDEQGNGGAVEEDLALLGQLCAEHDNLTSWLAFVERMSQESKAVSPDEEPPDAVVLQTIHRAKGTEAQEVHVINCIEGMMPHAMALAEAEDAEDPERALREATEEERRIAFVAFSRAAEHLFVYSTATNLMGKPSAPSRFISEAGL